MSLQEELKHFCVYLRTDPLYLDDLKTLVSLPNQPTFGRVLGYVNEYIDRYRDKARWNGYGQDWYELLMNNRAKIVNNIIETVMRLKAKK